MKPKGTPIIIIGIKTTAKLILNIESIMKSTKPNLATVKKTIKARPTNIAAKFNEQIKSKPIFNPALSLVLIEQVIQFAIGDIVDFIPPETLKLGLTPQSEACALLNVSLPASPRLNVAEELIFKTPDASSKNAE